MNELKKCCRYCSNFRNNRCCLEPFEIEYIECLNGVDFDEIEDKIQNNITIKDPDDFYCKYYY